MKSHIEQQKKMHGNAMYWNYIAFTPRLYVPELQFYSVLKAAV